MRSKISQYCIKDQNNTKRLKYKPFGLSRKGQGPNSLKSQYERTLGLMKQRKEKLSPTLKGKNRWEPGRKTEPGYLRIPKSLGSSRYVIGLG